MQDRYGRKRACQCGALIAPPEWADEMDWHCPRCGRALPKEVAVTKIEKETPPPAEKDPFEGLVAGRMVHYYPRIYERDAKEGPWAAIVTSVGENGVVTLNVQLPFPRPVGVDPVARFEKVPFGREEGCWSWMFDGQNTRYKPDRTA